jgi:hypothetical protein
MLADHPQKYRLPRPPEPPPKPPRTGQRRGACGRYSQPATSFRFDPDPHALIVVLHCVVFDRGQQPTDDISKGRAQQLVHWYSHYLNARLRARHTKFYIIKPS